MDISDKPTDRAVRAMNRNAVREALERDREYTATNTTTAMDKLASKSADDCDRTATVSRCMDDRNTTEDRRQMSSSDNPWLSASSQHFHPLTRTVLDSFAPPAFNGTNIDADTWLAHFRRYAEYRQLADRDITQIFPLFLKDSAIDWYDTLTADMKNDLDSLLGNFKAYFGKTELDYVFADETVFTRMQRPNVLKSVADILVGAVAESAGLGKDDRSADATKINQLMAKVTAGRDKVQQLNAKTQLNATSHADAE